MSRNHDAILAVIRANRERLDSCDRHLFEYEKVQIGQKLACSKCKGTMQLTDAGWYVKGYEAAGGNADDVWPGFRKPR